MFIIIEPHPWVEVKIYWPEKINYGSGCHKFTFFANEKQSSDAYNYAIKLKEMFSDFFDFDFYEEAGIKKVMFWFKRDYTMTFR